MEASQDLRRSECSAKDAFRFGHGDAAFTARGSEKLDLMPRDPAADGSGIDAKDGSYLANSKVLFHTPSVGQDGFAYLIISNVRSVFNVGGVFRFARASFGQSQIRAVGKFPTCPSKVLEFQVTVTTSNLFQRGQFGPRRRRAQKNSSHHSSYDFSITITQGEPPRISKDTAIPVQLRGDLTSDLPCFSVFQWSAQPLLTPLDHKFSRRDLHKGGKALE
ncbi:MAG: hypothetical protein O2913_13170 [Chloroflexi bacterium]|nr:hypothetical protein [Chloroflexota bacterium]